MSCEKAYTGEEEKGNVQELSKVTFTITDFEQIPFSDAIYGSRATTDMGQICTRIDLAVYDSEGTKVKSINQTAADNKFGTLSLSIPQGSYQVAILAHSGTGAPTMTALEKITFKDNKVTDTFYYYGSITVGENSSFSISLKRAVAMFRLITNDNTPNEVTQMRFYYTGGSSTFNAKTGFGCVNSRQTEIRSVPSGAHSSAARYEVYTFPHENEGKLKMTVTALDADGSEICGNEFYDVPVTVNKITQYSGDFFGGENRSASELRLNAEGEWIATDNIAY